MLSDEKCNIRKFKQDTNCFQPEQIYIKFVHKILFGSFIAAAAAAPVVELTNY